MYIQLGPHHRVAGFSTTHSSGSHFTVRCWFLQTLEITAAYIQIRWPTYHIIDLHTTKWDNFVADIVRGLSNKSAHKGIRNASTHCEAVKSKEIHDWNEMVVIVRWSGEKFYRLGGKLFLSSYLSSWKKAQWSCFIWENERKHKEEGDVKEWFTNSLKRCGAQREQREITLSSKNN